MKKMGRINYYIDNIKIIKKKKPKGVIQNVSRRKETSQNG